jgi:hypothetical protein
MFSLEKKVTASILNRVRTSREAGSEAGAISPAPGSRPLASVRIREACLADFERVRALKLRCNLNEDSLENWDRLWCRNPALVHLRSPLAIGWVLESQGRIVGYLGNIPLLYRYEDRFFTAAAGTSLAVEPAYRTATVSLISAFYHQKSVDLLLTTTAIEAVGKIAEAFNCRPVPLADFDAILFWVVKPLPFMRRAIRKLKLGAFLSAVAPFPASLVLSADRVLRRRRPTAPLRDLTIHELAIEEIGDEFQALWLSKIAEGPRLLADRSPAALRWHFEIPGDRGKAHVLCCRRNGVLVGYAIIRDDPNHGGLRKSAVSDLLVENDDPLVTAALCKAAYAHADSVGSPVLEVFGFPPNIRKVIALGNPYQRKYPACPFYYKAVNPQLQEMLRSGIPWYASPFDGDATLIRPSYAGSAGLGGPAELDPE